MKTLFRAMTAVALLAGYYVIAVGLAVGLMALDVAMVTTWHFSVGAVKVAAITLPAIITLARGVFMIGARSRNGGDADGPGAYEVTEEAQPELWATVRRIADAVGTRAPDEIRLVPAVNAGVSEKTRMLGLIPGRRLMVIGIPLLAALSEPELDAILAHELGHYANRDTRLAGITYRGRAAIGHTLQQTAGLHGIDSFLTRVFRSYAKLYLRVSQKVCQRQEYAADAASVRIAGPAAAASALRRVDPLSAAWYFFQTQYVQIGVDQGYLPSDVMGGFTAFLADPARQAQMREVVAKAGPSKASPYDSHPPMAKRVAAILGEAGEGPAEGTVLGRPARELLREPDRVLEDSFERALTQRARGLNRLGWEEFVHRTIHDATTHSVKQLFSAAAALSPEGRGPKGEGQLGTVLAVLASEGGAVRIGSRLPGEHVTDDSRRHETFRNRTRQALDLAVDVALAEAGKASWKLSWSATAQLVYAPELTQEQLTAALDAAVAAQPDVEPLRKILTEAGTAAT